MRNKLFWLSVGILLICVQIIGRTPILHLTSVFSDSRSVGRLASPMAFSWILRPTVSTHITMLPK